MNSDSSAPTDRALDREPRGIEYDGQGTAVRNFGVAIDITPKKLAEASLRQNAALFSTIIEHAPGGVYVVDPELRVQSVNSEALPVFAAVDPLIGRELNEVMAILWGAEVGAQLTGIFRNTLATGERYISPRFSATRHDLGVEQAYEWKTQRIILPDGQYRVVCYFNDVTERRRFSKLPSSRPKTRRRPPTGARIIFWQCSATNFARPSPRC